MVISKNSKKIIPFIFFFLINENIYAVNFQPIGRTTDHEHFVDYDSVNSRKKTVKILSNRFFRHPEGEKSYIGVVQFDCKKYKYRWKKITFYSGNMGSGRILFTKKNVPGWIQIRKGSPEEINHKLVCR